MRHHFKQPQNGYSAGEPAPRSMSAPPLNDMIGRRLRRHYEDLEDQPIPDRFCNLLEALDRSATASERRR